MIKEFFSQSNLLYRRSPLLELHSLYVNKSPRPDNPRRAYISENTTYGFFLDDKGQKHRLANGNDLSNFLFRTRKYCFKLCLALETGFSVPRQHLFQKSRNHRGKLMKQSSILELLRSIYKKRKKYPNLTPKLHDRNPSHSADIKRR